MELRERSDLSHMRAGDARVLRLHPLPTSLCGEGACWRVEVGELTRDGASQRLLQVRPFGDGHEFCPTCTSSQAGVLDSDERHGLLEWCVHPRAPPIRGMSLI